MSKSKDRVICHNCRWTGVMADLNVLGSVGRMHCPGCSADWGYPDGVTSVTASSLIAVEREWCAAAVEACRFSMDIGTEGYQALTLAAKKIRDRGRRVEVPPAQSAA